jgi:aspartyl-tRNA synthetase
LRMRSSLNQAFREELTGLEFVEIETPMLTKSTKEGARDFLVPSRFYPGKFYALPQSPQQYKQLLMTAGFERYFQMARCIRDEDLRADRGFEFTQLDIEASFISQAEIMQLVEQITVAAVKKVGGILKHEHFPIINYQDAIAKYGADKFDLRDESERQENKLAFAWVVNFPFFKKVDKSDAAEVEDSKSGWTFTHNPFSRPVDDHLEWHLKGENIDQIVTAQYDLVCNGYEIGGGSIRAHEPEVLRATMRIMGYSDSEIESSIGHMLEAFSLGTPPHGGIALGMDRLVMLLAGESSLKETIAFPMTSTGHTAVMDAPTQVSDKQLKELGLKLV